MVFNTDLLDEGTSMVSIILVEAKTICMWFKMAEIGPLVKCHPTIGFAVVVANQPPSLSRIGI